MKQCSNLLQHYIIDHRDVDTDSRDITDVLKQEKIPGISDFTMLRLRDIAEQRSLYSSVDDIVYANDSDSDFDEPFDLAIPRQKYGQMTTFSNGNRRDKR